MKVAVWLLVLAALPARAYERSHNNTGACIWWKTHGHSFQIDAQGTPDIADNAATYDAIRKSFATWGAVSCSDLTFAEESLSSNANDRLVGYFDGNTNHNLVLFRTRACRDVVPAGDACLRQGGCSNLYDCWDQGDGVIASTTTTSNSRTGEIIDSDIELNDAPSSNGSQYTFTATDGLNCANNPADCVRIDVQNTVTHEAGHSLGLDHSPDPSACMYASAPQGETSKRKLAPDDIQGICAIYPKGAASVTCTGQLPDSGGCGCSHNQTGSTGTVLAAVLLLLHFRRRSSKRPQLQMSARTDAATAARSQSGIEN